MLLISVKCTDKEIVSLFLSGKQIFWNAGIKRFYLFLQFIAISVLMIYE